MQLIAVSLTDQTMGLRNCVLYHPDQFGHKKPDIIRINHNPYRAVSNVGIGLGTIAMGLVVRTGHGIEIGKPVEVEVVDRYTDTKPEQSKFQIVQLFNPPKGVQRVPLELIQKAIHSGLGDYPLYMGQHLAVKCEQFTFRAVCQTTGRLAEEVDISCSERKLVITSIESILKNKFFDPDFSFEELGIGGLDDELKELFKQALTTRAYSPDIVNKLGTKHAKGILLYGPPGVGKTLIARKIGNLLSDLEPKVVNGPEILNKFVGQSEENLRNLFAEAQEDEKAYGNQSPVHVIIFDEIDAICKVRGSVQNSAGVYDSLVNQLLSVIDGVHAINNLFIIAMTNRKDLLDPALLRAGRIGIHVPISLPTEEGRYQILRIHTSQMDQHSLLSKDVDLRHLSKITTNYTGSELEQMVQIASSSALHDAILDKEETVSVTMAHFIDAMKGISPTMARHEVKHITIKRDDIDQPERLERLAKTVMDTDQPVRKVIIGGTLQERSFLVEEILRNSNHHYTGCLRPEQMVGKDEGGKTALMVDYYQNSAQFDRSLIVIDDLESLINYIQIGSSVAYGQTCFQSLISMFKSYPDSHCLDIIATCTEPTLMMAFKKHHIDELDLGKIDSNTVVNPTE